MNVSPINASNDPYVYSTYVYFGGAVIASSAWLNSPSFRTPENLCLMKWVIPS
ncbi:hypothetical protein BDQ12DRAFT_690622 [Crucibulum laeve]|uniref:Uncharacterized protein n=1 Tax=Crucibulum laeve TaxID=68775 RepID=A0A5C3LNB6_9AGAR|nr:hypothetical protein BDQ12DRAFT_690622 [Crucibulum laeve]